MVVKEEGVTMVKNGSTVVEESTTKTVGSNDECCVTPVEKSLTNCLDSEDEEAELNKDLHPISYYIVDREEMINQVFTVIKERFLHSILPPSLQDTPLEQIKHMCIEQVKRFSKNKLKNILNGEHHVSSGSDDELVRVKPKSADVVTVTVSKKPKIEPLVEDVDDTLNLQIQRKDDSLDLKKERKAIRRIKKLKLERQKVNAGNPDSGKSLMDLLELEMRARAIRALLQKQQIGEGDQSLDEEELAALLSDLDGFSSDSSENDTDESKALATKLQSTTPQDKVTKRKIPIKIRTLAEDIRSLDVKKVDESSNNDNVKPVIIEELDVAEAIPIPSPTPNQEEISINTRVERRYRKSNADSCQYSSSSSSELMGSPGEDLDTDDEKSLPDVPKESFEEAMDVDMLELIEKAKLNKPSNPEDYEEGELDEELNKTDLDVLRRKKLDEIKLQEEQERKEKESKEKELKKKSNHKRSRKSRRRRRSSSTRDFRRAVYGSPVNKPRVNSRLSRSRSASLEVPEGSGTRSPVALQSPPASPISKMKKRDGEPIQRLDSRPDEKNNTECKSLPEAVLKDGNVKIEQTENDLVSHDSDTSLDKVDFAERNDDTFSRITLSIEKKVMALNKHVEYLQANVFSQVNFYEDRMGETIREFEEKIPVYSCKIIELKKEMEKEIEVGIKDTGAEDQILMGMIEVLESCTATLIHIKSSMETLKVYYEARKKEIKAEADIASPITSPDGNEASDANDICPRNQATTLNSNDNNITILDQVSPEGIMDEMSNDTKESLEEEPSLLKAEESMSSTQDTDMKEISNPSASELVEVENIEEMTGLTWGMRWLQSEKVQKVYNTSKMFSKVRNKIKSLKKQSRPEIDLVKPQEDEKKKENNIKVIGSIEEYEKMFGKQIPKRDIDTTPGDTSMNFRSTPANVSYHTFSQSRVDKTATMVPDEPTREAVEEGEIDSEKENSEEEELWSRIMGD